MKRPAFVYLASQSPRRRDLLAQMGVACELLLPDANEDAESLERVLPVESPRRYVERVTVLKFEAALARLKHRGLPAAPVLCADTTVALGRQILGKPDTPQHARDMLLQLSHQTHRVLTAVVVGTSRRRVHECSVSHVQFASWTPKQIQRYVDSGEPMGKAGAYAIQGRASAYIAGIRGSYSGIMGLPLFETARALRQFGFEV